MKPRLLWQNNAGFTLVQAVFILVVLTLLGTAMMRLSGVQSATGLFALQGARAYQAARSGIEWGAAQSAAGNCASAAAFVVQGFNVTVDCTLSANISEGTTSYHVYNLSSLAVFGSYGSPDFVSRTVQAKVIGP